MLYRCVFDHIESIAAQLMHTTLGVHDISLMGKPKYATYNPLTVSVIERFCTEVCR